MSQPNSVLQRMRPEVGAGGFSHRNSTVQFYSRINALLGPEMVVLDVGAGRGQFLEDTCAYRRSLKLFRGRVKEVIGLDVDPAISENKALDRHYVIAPEEKFPLEDDSVDIVVSDWTFEHVAAPAHFCQELHRIIKKGGWICARTPNKWGLTAIAARLIPGTLHAALLRRLEPRRKEHDSFPVVYSLNTRPAIRKYFPPSQWVDCSYYDNGDPQYYGNSALIWRATDILFRLAPERFSANYFIFLQKRS